MADILHTKTGNCWKRAEKCRRCGAGNTCDVCHEHDEPRGECLTCPPCEACEMDDQR
jgi:hypothetical protein